MVPLVGKLKTFYEFALELGKGMSCEVKMHLRLKPSTEIVGSYL